MWLKMINVAISTGNEFLVMKYLNMKLEFSRLLRLYSLWDYILLTSEAISSKERQGIIYDKVAFNIPNILGLPETVH